MSLENILRIARRFGLHVTPGPATGVHELRPTTIGAIQRNIDRGLRAAEGRPDMATLAGQRFSPNALARAILDRQLEAGEASVAWDARQASAVRREESARRILIAISQRGEMGPFEAASLVLQEEGVANPNAVAAHALAVLTDDGQRQFTQGLLTEVAAEVRGEQTHRLVLDAAERVRAVALPDPLALSEVQAAADDAEQYGFGYLVDGKRVAPQLVQTFVRDTPEEGPLRG